MKYLRLRSLNTLTLSLLIGHLTGSAFTLIYPPLYFLGLFLGILSTFLSANEFAIALPFIRFSETRQKQKDLLLDASLLSDGRIIDLASSGLVDYQLVLPRFLLKELYMQPEGQTKKALETIKKLEQLPQLQLRYNDTDFPDLKDSSAKILRLARLLDANLLTADTARLQGAEGIRIINLNQLSHTLKPLMNAGEAIRIKIQRYGKEPRQGVGYLDDGTMVVVNGGGEYIGETIDVKVLSVKHTSSGRMIFCNTQDEEVGAYVEE